MSTKFQPRTKKRKPPPWCKPGMFPRSINRNNNLPQTLSASAWWKEQGATPPIDIAESFTVTWDSAAGQYYGESASPGLHLTLTIIQEPGLNKWTGIVELRDGDDFVDDCSWHMFTVAPPPGFDSGHINTDFTPHPDKVGFEAKA